MRKIIHILLFIAIYFLMVNTAFAAPAKWGIAINSEKQECAGYWSGDEFSHYRLPSGWESYYPDYETGSIETDFGKCNFTRYEKDCCESLGLTYVSSNIGRGSITNYGLQRSILSPIGLIILVLLVIIVFFVIRYFLKRKK